MNFFSLPRVSLAGLALLAAADACACSGRLHVEVAESGVYALDYASIVAAQPELKDCRANDLVLLHRDREVPIRVLGDAHGAFAAGSRIEWLGEAMHGPQSWFDQYSNVNVYQLAATPGPHARVREAAPPALTGPAAVLHRRAHFEREELMIRVGDAEMKNGEEPDVWQWAKLTPVDAQPFTFDFDLPDAQTSGRDADAALTLDFRGESNFPGKGAAKPADHNVAVTLNGRVVQTLQWDGREEIRRTLHVARALLKAQGNRLALRVPRRDAPGDAQNFIVDVVMFNWAEIDYSIRGDIAAVGSAFNATTNAPIEFLHSGTGVAALLGSDGVLRPGTALAGGRYRAAGAEENVDLYPFPDTPRVPLQLRAVAAGDLRSADPGYDYLVVAHPRLLKAIEPLAQYHRSHGMKVAVVDVDEIYDQFGGGIVHPAAIRDYVRWGHEHWRVKPRYLLLVGDASVDIHHDARRAVAPDSTWSAPNANLQPNEVLEGAGFMGMRTTNYAHPDPELANRNLVPTWQVASSAEGQSASDIPYVALTPGDFRPQLAVGRLPVVSAAEVEAVVRKTLAYLVSPPPGHWHRDLTFISTSEVSSYKYESDRLAADLASRGYAVRNVYTDPHEDPSIGRAKRAALKRDLDDGGLIVHFLGHGGSYIWRVGGAGGDLFTLDDVAAMQNVGRYPMVLAMTCFSAPYDSPTADSIGERFLREADKGAVAVLGASWSNSPDPNFSRALLDELLRPGATIGEAINKAKSRVHDRTSAEMYNLLGDPALVLARPSAELHIEPVADRWDSRLIVQVPSSDFGGIVDVDWVDAQGGIIASRHYEARDRQFYITMPVNADKAVVYTDDTRNGSQAFGAFSRPAPAAPPPLDADRMPVAPHLASVVPAASVPAASVPAPAAAAAVTAPSTLRNLPDKIASFGFDAEPPALAANMKRDRH